MIIIRDNFRSIRENNSVARVAKHDFRHADYPAYRSSFVKYLVANYQIAHS